MNKLNDEPLQAWLKMMTNKTIYINKTNTYSNLRAKLYSHVSMWQRYIKKKSRTARAVRDLWLRGIRLFHQHEFLHV
jgi:hypothetical protein